MSKFQLIDKDNSALIFIDHQPQMAFGVANIDRQQLKNNVVGLAKAGKIFNVPTLFTSVETESFSGYIWPELLAVHPEITPIERTSMNSGKTRPSLKPWKPPAAKAGDLRAVDRSVSNLPGADGAGSRL